MKVRFLTPMATASDSFDQDEVRELPQVQASQLIASGIAAPVHPQAEPRRTFPRGHSPAAVRAA